MSGVSWGRGVGGTRNTYLGEEGHQDGHMLCGSCAGSTRRHWRFEKPVRGPVRGTRWVWQALIFTGKPERYSTDRAKQRGRSLLLQWACFSACLWTQGPWLHTTLHPTNVQERPSTAPLTLNQCNSAGMDCILYLWKSLLLSTKTGSTAPWGSNPQCLGCNISSSSNKLGEQQGCVRITMKWDSPVLGRHGVNALPGKAQLPSSCLAFCWRLRKEEKRSLDFKAGTWLLVLNTTYFCHLWAIFNSYMWFLLLILSG